MIALKMSPVLTFSKYFNYQLPYKEYLITVFKFCPFLLYQLFFRTFWCKLRDFVADHCKIMVH